MEEEEAQAQEQVEDFLPTHNTEEDMEETTEEEILVEEIQEAEEIRIKVALLPILIDKPTRDCKLRIDKNHLQLQGMDSKRQDLVRLVNIVS